MTAPVPVVEVIAERMYGGQPTVRVLCVYCSRTHLHVAPADADSAIVALCGQGIYTIGTPTTKGTSE